MSTLKPGAAAPDMSLKSLNGSGEISLRQSRQRGPVVAAFFKVSCPVCQLAFPYLERIYKAYGDSKVSFVGVSQDDASASRAFAGDFKITFPVALDNKARYLASNAFKLTNVPSIFLISSEGKIEIVSIGWDKKDFEELNRRVANASGKPPVPLFKPGEQVPDFKAG